jgi:DNA replication protein DnaC
MGHSEGGVFGGLVEPKWLTCGCGEQTSRVPCWDCSRKQRDEQAAAEERASAEATYPKRYAWARLGAPDLLVRVKASGDVESLARRILAAGTVVIHGPGGAGKTSLAVACLRARTPAGLFVPSWRLGTARIQSAAGRGEASLVEAAIAAPILLIDDVGREPKTANNALADVVFARHDEDLPTWITTGFDSDALGSFYGDGFVRRITEGALLVPLAGGAKQRKPAQAAASDGKPSAAGATR